MCWMSIGRNIGLMSFANETTLGLEGPVTGAVRDWAFARDQTKSRFRYRSLPLLLVNHRGFGAPTYPFGGENDFMNCKEFPLASIVERIWQVIQDDVLIRVLPMPPSRMELPSKVGLPESVKSICVPSNR